MPKKKQQAKPPLPPKTGVVKFLPPWQSGVPGPAMGIAEEDVGTPYDWSHISEQQKAIRRMFVLEYLKDFNGTQAFMRMGLKYSQPAERANSWLREPYTQFILDRVLDEVKSETLITRNRVIAGLLREANAYGLDSSGASRVSALRAVAKILGLEVTKIEADVRVAGGVMLVPMASNPEEWEKHAVPAQTALRLHAVA